MKNFHDLYTKTLEIQEYQTALPDTSAIIFERLIVYFHSPR